MHYRWHFYITGPKTLLTSYTFGRRQILGVFGPAVQCTGSMDAWEWKICTKICKKTLKQWKLIECTQSYTYIQNPISAGRNLAHKKKTNQCWLTKIWTITLRTLGSKINVRGRLLFFWKKFTPPCALFWTPPFTNFKEFLYSFPLFFSCFLRL